MRRRRVRARLGLGRAGRTGGSGVAIAVGRLLARAGLPGEPEVLGTSAVVTVAGAVAGMRLVAPGRGLAGVVAGAWLAHRFAARARTRAARMAGEDAERGLPDVLERLGTAVRSGCSMSAAVALVAPGTPGPLGSALQDAVRVADLGGSRREMLAAIARAPGDQVARVVATLLRSDRLGVPVADAVDALAGDLRARARAAAETSARTAPVRMLFPLAFCFLPAFVLLTIAPIAIEALRTLGGISRG